jgi:hypothetical protein
VATLKSKQACSDHGINELGSVPAARNTRSGEVRHGGNYDRAVKAQNDRATTEWATPPYTGILCPGRRLRSTSDRTWQVRT